MVQGRILAPAPGRCNRARKPIASREFSSVLAAKPCYRRRAAPRETASMAPNDPITLELDGLALTLELFDSEAPGACAVVRKREVRAPTALQGLAVQRRLHADGVRGPAPRAGVRQEPSGGDPDHVGDPPVGDGSGRGLRARARRNKGCESASKLAEERGYPLRCRSREGMSGISRENFRSPCRPPIREASLPTAPRIRDRRSTCSSRSCHDADRGLEILRAIRAPETEAPQGRARALLQRDDLESDPRRRPLRGTRQTLALHRVLQHAIDHMESAEKEEVEIGRSCWSRSSRSRTPMR